MYDIVCIYYHNVLSLPPLPLSRFSVALRRMVDHRFDDYLSKPFNEAFAKRPSNHCRAQVDGVSSAQRETLQEVRPIPSSSVSQTVRYYYYDYNYYYYVHLSGSRSEHDHEYVCTHVWYLSL